MWPELGSNTTGGMTSAISSLGGRHCFKSLDLQETDRVDIASELEFDSATVRYTVNECLRIYSDNWKQ